MSGIKLLLYGIAGQQVALISLFSDHGRVINLVFFLIGHTIATACFSIILAYMVPQRFGVRYGNALAAIFGLIFFVPAFGALGMFTILIYFRYFQQFKARTEFYSAPLPPFMAESGGLAPGMGEGGAWSRLRTASVPRNMRLKALLAVSAGGGQNSSRLLQMATGDSDDEIRLLAFKLADQREKVIGATISESLKALKSAESDMERLGLYRKLAFSYWEMVFNELNRDLSEFFIGQSLHYANMVLGSGKEDHALMILLARIYLRKGELEQAEEFINMGLQMGAHRDKVVPYLAELAYRKRDFRLLKGLFAADPLLRFKPGIGPVAKFWMGRQ